ncbi:4-alpha-glucanotransferase [Streptomyces sp. SP18CS02]|uniref:4-alpha-glucanotransferase n=1 Tax=Streptomyces sp. SP18CS02 TaxID=3002531 RepID=UPI002E779225|nr:4-alpha-glucanotransferase [Streptomyces sp. SP18CS02]MEE1752155.1 4-alpha-glucanotransferase [Streptomyces sp. SP18CS02]
MPPTPELAELARLHGVDTHYTTDLGHRVDTGPDTLRAVLAALGVDAATPAGVRAALAERRHALTARLLPPVVVLRSGRPRPGLSVPPGTAIRVRTEDGRTHRVGSLGKELADFPVGRHTLHATRGGRSEAVPLLIAPERLPGPAHRGWGFLVQLYSLLSRRSWGMGDLGDLAGLARWAGGLGADFIQLNPLHAYVPGPMPDPSPYRPGSRRYADPMNLRIETVPEYAALAPGDRETAARLTAGAARLRDDVLDGDLIDRAAVRDLKLRALELLHRVPLGPGRSAAYRQYVAGEGPGLDDYATWCALAEVHGPRWRSWPAGLRSPGGTGIAAARRDLADRIEFHRRVAWLVDDQLAEAQRAATGAGMAIGLMHDLAVGVDPEGADAWSFQSCLAQGMTVGCPPDDFNPHGQDWGQPPWRPDALAEAGYGPFAEVLRGTLRRSGALRLDHIMGLFRLWWIPDGAGPGQGTYVRYDHEALLGVLALEAHRAGSLVIGEDLGTVERGVREELADRGILGTSVLRFEYLGGPEQRSGPLPPERWRGDCLATLTTHDLPSTAAWLEGAHVRLHERLGLLGEPLEQAAVSAASERAAWLAELDRLGALGPGSGTVPGREALGLHRFLALTPAKLLGVWLPDTVGDRRPQNLPGTADEYPNWRLPVADPDGRPLTLEDLAGHEGPRAVAELYRDLSGAPDGPGACRPGAAPDDGLSDEPR